jgi:hypothetical protein
MTSEKQLNQNLNLNIKSKDSLRNLSVDGNIKFFNQLSTKTPIYQFSGV